MVRKIVVAAVVIGVAVIFSGVAGATPYTLQRTFTVPTVFRLDGMAYDSSSGNLFGVNASGTPDTLYEFSTTGSLIVFILLLFLPNVGGSRGLAYDPNSGNLFLSEIANGDIYELTTAGAHVGTLNIANSLFGLTYNTVSNTLFGASGSTIYEYNPSNGNLINSFASPGTMNGLAFDGTNLLAYEGLVQRVDELNPSNGALIQSFPVGFPWGDSGMTFDGKEVYIWNDTSGVVEVYGLGAGVVPEPGGLLLFCMAAPLLASVARRRRG
jgi:hypothetical protein